MTFAAELYEILSLLLRQFQITGVVKQLIYIKKRFDRYNIQQTKTKCLLNKTPFYVSHTTLIYSKDHAIYKENQNNTQMIS